MKNILKSKGFLFSVLAIACVGVLTVCILVNMDAASTFKPEEIAADTEALEQQDISAPAAAAENHTKADTPAPARDPLEGYPKVVAQSEDEVVIDFTPESTELQPEPPEPPTAEGDTTDPSAPPTYTAEDTTPEPSGQSAQGSSPAPGQTRGDGAVYDPVFGWIVPGQVEQIPADSNGDINKMVGNMGG